MACATRRVIIRRLRFTISHIHRIDPISIPKFGWRTFPPARPFRDYLNLLQLAFDELSVRPLKRSAVSRFLSLVDLHHCNGSIGEFLAHFGAIANGIDIEVTDLLAVRALHV